MMFAFDPPANSASFIRCPTVELGKYKGGIKGRQKCVWKSVHESKKKRHLNICVFQSAKNAFQVCFTGEGMMHWSYDEKCGNASLFSDKIQSRTCSSVFINCWDQWAEVLSSESGLSSRVIIEDQLQTSAAVRHDDTHQSASPWCSRESETVRERQRRDGGWHHSPPSLRPAWLAGASGWEWAAPSPPEADFTRFSFSERRTKEKKSSWWSQAGAFRQSEQLGQTIIVSPQSWLSQITTGTITLLPPHRLGAPNWNLWWCVGNPSLIKNTSLTSLFPEWWSPDSLWG